MSPVEVVRLARRNGLTAIALTDHDTVAGNTEAAAEAVIAKIDFLPASKSVPNIRTRARCTCWGTASIRKVRPEGSDHRTAGRERRPQPADGQKAE